MMPLRLLVVSNMAHYFDGQRLVGWGPTVEELTHLASLFHEVVHVACLYQGPAPASALPYGAPNLRLEPVPPAGGPSWLDKLGILVKIPAYVRTVARHLPNADAVHVRAPANISLLAIVLLAFFRRPGRRWIKYAGNWRAGGQTPWSYRFQRWWLRRNFARAQVTVNGRWPDDPSHVHAFPNPCLTAAEYGQARTHAVSKNLEAPITLLFAGALTPNKGAAIAVETLARLQAGGVDARLVVAGDGPQKAELASQVQVLGLEDKVTFLGFVPHPCMGEHYRRAHFVVLPSQSEGWPKVLGEGMAYGAVPIASAVSSIPQVLEEAGSGRAIDSFEPSTYAAAIREYLVDPQRWCREARDGSAYAERFTYEEHVERVRQLLALGGGGR